MKVVRPSSASAFLDLARPLLAGDPVREARHNLMLGIARTVVSHPDAYDTDLRWVVVEGSTPLAAAFMTPPHNVIVSDAEDLAAIDALVDAIRADDAPLPGTVANDPWAAAFAKAWTAASGERAEVTLAQGVYALTEVRNVQVAAGEPRRATREDRELLASWIVAFADEALPPDRRHTDSLVRGVDVRLGIGSGEAGYWLWEDGGAPVSFAGFFGPTGTGIRVGPVYTSPAHRGRGYATGLVAELSRWLLARGYRACYLYTDLTNPTSNKIYVDIGYERICDSTEYWFRAD